MIQDGMNGEYIIIGKVLAKGLESDGLDMTCCEVSDSERKKIYQQLRKDFKDCIVFDFRNVKTYAFTHFH